MTGSLSNIGLGSNGALNYDIIDQLREVDETNRIDPIDRQLDENEIKSNDLSTITTLTATLKGTTSALSSEASYLQRTTSVIGDSAEVNAQAGSATQDFTLDVISLANQDIFQTVSFSSDTSTFTSSSSTISISIDGNSYDIDVDSTTTISELKDMITEATDGKVIASILNVGGVDPYKLTLKSAQTGTDQAMSITSTGTAVADLGLDDAINHIQVAQDANFNYDGVSIIRSSNSIDDLIVGVNIELKDTGLTSISIKQDTQNIKTGLDDFVAQYNELISNLNEATKFTPETKESGIFQGVSQITTMKSSINSIIFDMDKSGDSLLNYGISLNSNNLLEIDKDVLEAKLLTDPDGVKNFFSGTDGEEKDGLFTSLNSLLEDLVVGESSVLGAYEENLVSEAKNLNTQKQDALASLDSKYEIMVKKFMAYDAIIGRLNAEFQSLSMMIEESYKD